MRTLIISDEQDELYEYITAIADRLREQYPKKPHESRKRYQQRIDRLISKVMDEGEEVEVVFKR